MKKYIYTVKVFPVDGKKLYPLHYVSALLNIGKMKVENTLKVVQILSLFFCDPCSVCDAVKPIS
jgi:hypothetical protein